MADWIDLRPDVKSSWAKSKKEPVRFALIKSGHGGKGRAKANVIIRADIAAQMGVTDDEVKVHVRRGAGANAHQLAIVVDKGGLFTLGKVGRPTNSGDRSDMPYKVKLPHVEDWPDIAIPQLSQSYKIEKGNTMIVDLPPECWDRGVKAKVTAAAAKAAVSAKPSLASAR